MPKRLILVALLLAGAVAGAWWYMRDRGAPDELRLVGNVDFRQVTLAFNGSERIAEVLVEEGATVHKGQVVARLDTARLQPQVDQVNAQVAAQQANLDRLRNGNRPEEIAQGQASLTSAQAQERDAQLRYERQVALLEKSVTSRQAYDESKVALDVAQAKVEATQKALDLLVAGSRKEDIAQAEAQVRASKAQLALLREQLADAELKSPVDGIVSSRLMEPGEMASTTRPVFSLAVSDPKWVRAYVSEPQLRRVRPGMAARVTIDSMPDEPFEGWVGFISPVAEFTPKTVQTEDLRTSLVYEVRVFARDPENILRLGMPATVRLLPAPPNEAQSKAAP
ncbi:MAG TPA: efflux RND transporter periplasmic adaptor subunit [Xanthobacteraceae bacterium]|nr:efflux RND transporter periplasmic adaptor subunit [Xanthobacteraceae bacterium]